MQQTLTAHAVPASQSVPSQTTASPRTLTVDLPCGPMVVDIWEPRRAADVPPILLIHGWGGSGQYWAESAEILSETARVIVPDLPGSGRSMPVAPAQDMYDQVDNLVALLDALGLERVQLNGHSMGGAMTLLLADRVPEKIDRIVLTSTCFFLNEAQKRIYDGIMRLWFVVMRVRGPWMANLPMLTRASAYRYFYRIPDDEALLRAGFMDFITMDFETARACAHDAGDEAITEAGSRVQAPTLLVACRQDTIMPTKNVGYTASLIPRSEVRWIENCGHLPMVEKPTEYLSILQDFLAL